MCATEEYTLCNGLASQPSEARILKSTLFHKIVVLGSVVLAYPAGLRGVANSDQSMAGSLQVLLY